MTTATTTTAEQLLEHLLARHTSNGRHDCGAQTQEQPCLWSRNGSVHVYHCTLEPGHEGPHKDALHCWHFETFTSDQVVRWAPRDLSTCTTCNETVPCRERTALLALTEELGVGIPEGARP